MGECACLGDQHTANPGQTCLNSAILTSLAVLFVPFPFFSLVRPLSLPLPLLLNVPDDDDMGSGLFCCFPDPVDFDADVNLFHFELHRAIGKGAFGKVNTSHLLLRFSLT